MSVVRRSFFNYLLKGSSTKKNLSLKSHILDCNGVWYSSFCWEGRKNHLNLNILVPDFVPRGFEARRRWGFEARREGFRGMVGGVSRHSRRGGEVGF